MPRFTFHEATIKVAHVFIIQSFTQSFKALTTPCLDKRHSKQMIKQALIRAATLFLKLDQFVHVDVLTLLAQRQFSFVQLSEYLPEMSPFFRNNGAKLYHEFFLVRIFLDQRDAGGRSFLLTVGMIS